MEKLEIMISTKDLSYIEDIFNWNIVALKKVEFYLKNCNDKKICTKLKQVSKLHHDNCNKVLKLLKECECCE